jgi:glycosyltransferase involved in cell wall biosynthesis
MISVVIPTFNRADTISRAVRSILKQDTIETEVVVIDDGSTDDTAAVLAEIADSRLTVLAQPNSGRCAARNAGAGIARHDWLVFLDSDDELLPGSLNDLAAHCTPPTNLIITGLERSRQGDVRVVTSAEKWVSSGAMPSGLQAGAFAIQRELFNAIGGYCTELDHSEHTEMVFRLGNLSVKPVIELLAFPMVRIFEQDHEYDAELNYRTATHLLDHLDSEFADNPWTRSIYLVIAGVAASRLGRRRESVTLLFHALRLRPRAKTAARLARALAWRA